MESFTKKIEQVLELCKSVKASIKLPKPQPLSKPPATPKSKGVAPGTKKDPVKIAEQIQNPDTKPMAMDSARQAKETLKISKHGQWKIN